MKTCRCQVVRAEDSRACMAHLGSNTNVEWQVQGSPRRRQGDMIYAELMQDIFIPVRSLRLVLYILDDAVLKIAFAWIRHKAI